MPNKRRKLRKPKDIVLSDSPTIVSIDPGGTTGWSVIAVHPEALCEPDISILNNIEHWGHGQITGDENEQAAEILGLIDTWPGCAVLFEDFILRTAIKSREVLSPVRITARVEFGLYLSGGQQIWKQMPSEAMTIATDDRLKQWGFYERSGGMGHARDADRHGLVWLRKAKASELVRRSCWPHLYGENGPYYVPVTIADEEDEELG